MDTNLVLPVFQAQPSAILHHIFYVSIRNATDTDHIRQICTILSPKGQREYLSNLFVRKTTVLAAEIYSVILLI